MQAARDVLAVDGVAGLTIARVAERAGVSRPTAYRRWPTPAALVFELQSSATVPAHVENLGSLRPELVAAVTYLVLGMAAADRDVQANQLGEMIRDQEFSLDVQHRRWNPDRALVRRIWDRAVERGEAPTSTVGDRVIDDIVAICIFDVFLRHMAPTHSDIERLVDRLLYGVVDEEAQAHRSTSGDPAPPLS